MKYDVLIPVGTKDFDILPYCLRSLHHLSPYPESVIVVCPQRDPVTRILGKCNFDAVVVADEEVFDFAGVGRKPGWFQQVIKLFQQVTRDDYLVWDADLILPRRFHVFGFNDRPLLRYHKSPTAKPNAAYNAFMMEAFGQTPAVDMTMVCHHMFFRRCFVEQMIDCFLERHPKPDDRTDAKWFYDWLMSKGQDYELSVSEYEAYAHYVLNQHPTAYELAKVFLDDFVFIRDKRSPTEIERRIGSTRAEMVALHHRTRRRERSGISQVANQVLEVIDECVIMSM